MKTLSIVFALMLLLSCKKENNFDSASIGGLWVLDTYSVTYYDPVGKKLKEEKASRLGDLETLTIQTDSVILENAGNSATAKSTFSTRSGDGAATLPVTFMSFTARNIDNKVFISWVTANEANNSHFLVQMSASGSNFQEIARVQGAGQAHTYAATAENIFGWNYFRLKQVDFDEKFYYSNIVSCVVPKLKVLLQQDGDTRYIKLPSYFAPFNRVDIKRSSASTLTLSGNQTNVTFTEDGTVRTADRAEIKMVFKSK